MNFEAPMVDALPVAAQGPLYGLAHLVAGALALAAVWWLVRPLLRRGGAPRRPPGGTP